jgi:hypothetical protein
LEYLRALERIGGFGCDVLLLNCGLHDIKTDPPTGRRQVGPEDYAANLQAILSLVPRLARRLVWVRTTPVDQEQHNRSGRTFQRFEKDVDLYNGLADRAMAARGIASADLHSFTRSLQGPLYEDGVHFRDEVRVRQAAFLAGFLSGLAAPGMV